jgi:excisionase family DNA binding protein
VNLVIDERCAMHHYHPMRELMTTNQAAESLKVSRATVLRLVETGRLRASAKAPGLRGAYLFDAADIDQLVASTDSN